CNALGQGAIPKLAREVIAAPAFGTARGHTDAGVIPTCTDLCHAICAASGEANYVYRCGAWGYGAIPKFTQAVIAPALDTAHRQPCTRVRSTRADLHDAAGKTDDIDGRGAGNRGA